MVQVDAFIGLGSNMGDRLVAIRTAITLLKAVPGIEVRDVSSLLDTEPVGNVQQPRFINAVVRIVTSLDPFELHTACLAIEQAMGRVRKERWGPRIIDLDILIYGDQNIHTPTLTIPHPEINNRPFVLDGLAELGAHV